MPKAEAFTIEIDPELRRKLESAAAAADCSPAEVVRDLIEGYVGAIESDPDHDAWFRREVEAGLREADDPSVRRIPNSEVMAELRSEQDRLRRLLGDGEL